VSARLEVHGRHPDTGQDVCLRQIPLRDLDRLILHEGVQFSSEALAEVLRRSIPVVILAHEGRTLGHFSPAGNAHGHWRLRQYQRTLETGFVMDQSGRIVAAKLYNQRRVLQRMAANRKRTITSDTDYLAGLLGDCRRAGTLDELRGLEGAAAARYFNVWASFLPEAFPFERRSTRPPLNAVNACLSFGSTLLYHEVTAALHAVGLDPALGLLHTTQDDRWSLALDLMEPFRPVLTEALALDLFTHQILNADHFEPQNGGIYLNRDGRARFLLQYERRIERQFMAEAVGHRTTLRQQISAQAGQFKASLEQPEKFEPFLMN
jgi:CRISPR-associated endonuclease Cas1